MFAKLRERQNKVALVAMRSGVSPAYAVLAEAKKINPYGFIWNYCRLMYSEEKVNKSMSDLMPSIATVALGAYFATKNLGGGLKVPPHIILGGLLHSPWGPKWDDITKKNGKGFAEEFWKEMTLTVSDIGLLRHLCEKVNMVRNLANQGDAPDYGLDNKKVSSAIHKLKETEVIAAHHTLYVYGGHMLWPTLFGLTGWQDLKEKDLALPAESDLKTILMSLSPQQKCQIVQAISCANAKLATQLIQVSSFVSVTCLAKTGVATDAWLNSRWTRLNTDVGQLMAELTKPTVEHIQETYAWFFAEAESVQLISGIFGTNTILKHLEQMQFMTWVLEQSRGQNLTALTAIAGMLTSHQILSYTLLSGLNGLVDQFYHVCRSMIEVINNPFCALKQPSIPAAKYPDLAFLGIELMLRRGSGLVSRASASGYAGSFASRCTNTSEMLSGIVTAARDMAASDGAKIASISALIRRVSKRVVTSVNDPDAIFEFGPDYNEPEEDRQEIPLSMRTAAQLRTVRGLKEVNRAELIQEALTPKDLAVQSLCRIYLKAIDQVELPLVPADGKVSLPIPGTLTVEQCDLLKQIVAEDVKIDAYTITVQKIAENFLVSQQPTTVATGGVNE